MNGKVLIFSCILIILSSASCVFCKDDADDVKWEEKWMNQPIDHFNPYYNESATFQQRYMISRSFCKLSPCSGIILYTGNEGDIMDFVNSAKYLWTIANETNSIAVFAEYRYYGKSLIPPHSEEQPYRFLSTEQAISDFANLVSYLREEEENDGSSSPLPVIAIGGSYGGMLAFYLRAKFPWLVQGAIASSAPILGYAGLGDPTAIYRVINDDYQDCSVDVGTAFRMLWRGLKQSSSLRTELLQALRICGKQNVDETKENEAIIGFLQSAFYNMAALDYPYSVSFIGFDLPPFPTKKACSAFNLVWKSNNTNNSNNDILLAAHALRAAADILYPLLPKAKEQNCSVELEAEFEAYLPGLTDGPWAFQRCSDVILPSIVDAKTAPIFLSCEEFTPNCWKNDGERFRQFCLRTYGTDPRGKKSPSRLAFGMSVVELLNSGITNLIFTNGNLDPWGAESVNCETIQKITATRGRGKRRGDGDRMKIISMKGAAHHLDLREPNMENDPEDVVKARRIELAAVKRWLGQQQQQQANENNSNINIDEEEQGGGSSFECFA